MHHSIIFHVDVNSAYLSWSAIWDLQHGGKLDIRTIPAIVGGNPESRHGIVLAKSIPAKKFGIVTGESLYSALVKCPHLKIVAPKFSIYLKASDSLVDLLNEYSSVIERYSIDECFMDMGDISREEALTLARKISSRIHEELGFTVNIGISINKILAKTASDFKKPNGIHTLYPEEMEEKMWPLPVDNLFMVGPKVAIKLKNMNIMTIGKLARTDRRILLDQFMKYGHMLHAFANGIDPSPVHEDGSIEAKGVGNSTTLPYDIKDIDLCYKTLLSLLETLVPRLKATNKKTSCIKVHYTSSDFKVRSRQRKLSCPIDSLNEIYPLTRELFKEVWQGEAIRKIGISVTSLVSKDLEQLSIFDLIKDKKRDKVEATMGQIRDKFGKDSLVRGTFINSPIHSHEGGIGEDGYIIMGTKV